MLEQCYEGTWRRFPRQRRIVGLGRVVSHYTFCRTVTAFHSSVTSWSVASSGAGSNGISSS